MKKSLLKVMLVSGFAVSLFGGAATAQPVTAPPFDHLKCHTIIVNQYDSAEFQTVIFDESTSGAPTARLLA